jgi:hypothetical protein
MDAADANRITDADDRFLRNPRAAAANRREHERADEREREADPVDDPAVWIAAGNRQQQRDRRAERRDLRERQVHEDDAALHDVHAEIGVDAGEDQTRDERRRQKLQNGRIEQSARSGFLQGVTSRFRS